MAFSAIVVALCVAFICIYLAVALQHRRAVSVKQLSSWKSVLPRARRLSTSKTPSRSLSPQKKVPANVPPPVEYRNIFPPSQRDTLHLVAGNYLEPAKTKLLASGLSELELKKNIIPLTADFRECGPSVCTPTGFSIEEIKALGDFPNYADLSGHTGPFGGLIIRQCVRCQPHDPMFFVDIPGLALTKLENNWWLELESTYVARISQRKNLFAKHGGMVLAYLPGSELACKELMEMALQFLCARYPQYFFMTKDPSRGHILHNRLLKNETIIDSMHPLHVLLENVPEDFACMLRNPDDGYYYLRAGVICSALGWNLGTKIGLQLRDVHGPVPDYKEKMEFSMDRYFSKLPASKPIQRGSWGLEVDTPLFMPPNDPHEAYRLSQDPDMPLSRVHLRVDWQTLRRLPLSGAIVFNFKGLFTPVEELRDEPYVPALCLKVLKEGKKSIMEYKNTWHIEHVVCPALEEWSKEQVRQGKADREWEVKTLDESPWFPGWEEKWHGQQGF
ncbi:MAG: hypothetical protein Q9191_002583 [Dirinaria sp. TL-2023a]